MPNNYKNAWRDSAKKNNTTKTAQDIRLCAKRTRNATAKVVDASEAFVRRLRDLLAAIVMLKRKPPTYDWLYDIGCEI